MNFKVLELSNDVMLYIKQDWQWIEDKQKKNFQFSFDSQQEINSHELWVQDSADCILKCVIQNEGY